jgi:hypothetical protein
LSLLDNTVHDNIGGRDDTGVAVNCIHDIGCNLGNVDIVIGHLRCGITGGSGDIWDHWNVLIGADCIIELRVRNCESAKDGEDNEGALHCE